MHKWQQKRLIWLDCIVSIIPAIFSVGLKITDAHFASVNEHIQDGLEDFLFHNALIIILMCCLFMSRSMYKTDRPINPPFSFL